MRECTWDCWTFFFSSMNKKIDVQLIDRFSTCQKREREKWNYSFVTSRCQKKRFIIICHTQIIFEISPSAIIRRRSVKFLYHTDTFILSTLGKANFYFSLSLPLRLFFVTCHTSHRRLPINLRLNFDWMWHASLSLSCRRQRHCSFLLHPLPSKCQFISSWFEEKKTANAPVEVSVEALIIISYLNPISSSSLFRQKGFF